MLEPEKSQETATETVKDSTVSNVLKVMASVTENKLGIAVDDDDCIVISVRRYEELIRAQTERDVAVRLIKGAESYNLRDSLIIALGIEPKARGKSDE
ncbi:MAG: hypothetical protein LBK57_03680 [Clostridiales Family XIII bacterium]|jgi:hypothetical protein|nr:hypothetical protein [Clostridiales Family XIII bacterium]